MKGKELAKYLTGKTITAAEYSCIDERLDQITITLKGEDEKMILMPMLENMSTNQSKTRLGGHRLTLLGV